MDQIRVARTAPTTLRHTVLVGETPTDPDGQALTVTITDLVGTAAPITGAATRDGIGSYRFAWPGDAVLGEWRVDWSYALGGAPVVESGQLLVVGGHYATVPQIRGSDTSLQDDAVYPLAAIEVARTEVSAECERICDRAMVPRARRVTLAGTGTPEILLPDGDIRSIRTASIAPRFGQPAVELTEGQLAALVVGEDQVLRRADGAVWTAGLANVTLVYEFGLDRPPPDLRRAWMTRLRWWLQQANSDIPDRAATYTAADGGTYRLTTADADRTGMHDVDAAYSRWSRRPGTGTGSTGRPVPASRTLDYNPQRDSLFHGGVR